jgi:chromosome segregation ATPase
MITEYSKTEAALSGLAAKYKGVVFDVTTKEGMTDAKKSRAEIRTYRIDLEKVRKEIKAPALLKCQQIDTEARRITSELEALENPIDEQIKKEENRVEEEKLAQLRAAQEKYDAEQRAIKEAEETRMISERAEIAKQQAELIAAQKSARYKIEQEERAARLRIEEEERKARMEREEADRNARKEREAEEAKLKAERDNIEAERRKVEEAQRKEREAEEAKQREILRQEVELQDAYGMLDLFVKRFGHLKEFYKIVSEIKAFKPT